MNPQQRCLQSKTGMSKYRPLEIKVIWNLDTVFPYFYLSIFPYFFMITDVLERLYGHFVSIDQFHDTTI